MCWTNVTDGTLDTIADSEAKSYFLFIREEMSKLTKDGGLGGALKELWLVNLVIHEEDRSKNQPMVYATRYPKIENINDTHQDIKSAMEQFVKEGNYDKYNQKYEYELHREFSRMFAKYLDDSNIHNCEHWCRCVSRNIVWRLKSDEERAQGTAEEKKEDIIQKTAYSFMILRFDQVELERRAGDDDRRHPFLDMLKDQWALSKSHSLGLERKQLNGFFLDAARRGRDESSLSAYFESYNILSSLMYESGVNHGSILAHNIRYPQKEENPDFEVLIELQSPITLKKDIYEDPIDNDSNNECKKKNNYKIIRKLLETVNEDCSLLMNDKGEIYGIGKHKPESTEEYYGIQFRGRLQWEYKKNGQTYLYFENSLPMFPRGVHALSSEHKALLERTFNGTAANCEKIIDAAAKQRHGTTVVITTNAQEEAERLQKTGICIVPVELVVSNNDAKDSDTNSEENVENRIVEQITAIDGAIICDTAGICYSIGTILDGYASTKGDASRGARYNSAIRYIQRQKDENPKDKTFIAVISEDGYIDCFSTVELESPR